MTTSILSSPSTRDSREDGLPPKKRARGRPLKNAGQSNIPEERRKQVRKAQEAFRQRKQAAVKSLEQRAEALEDCVEQISEVFLSFSDSMLKTQLIQKDPEIGRNLLSTTSRIVALARLAVSDDLEETSGSSSPEAENEVPGSRIVIISENKSSNHSAIDIPHSRLSSASRPNNLFGNGWFDFEPRLACQVPRDNQDLSVPPLGFGLNLIRNNLQVAYFALLDESGIYKPLILQMFRYAFLYHSKEEILANLRWFLDQGKQQQRYLGRAVFGFDTTLSLQHLNVVSRSRGEFKPKVLHPLVDAQALLEADYTSSQTPFLNAFDIEEYLITKGAFHIDEEVIRMQTSFCGEENGTRSDTGQPIQNDPSGTSYLSGIYDTDPWNTTNTASSNLMNAEPISLPPNISLIDSIKQLGAQEGKHCEMFDFNALLKDENHQSIMRQDHEQEKKEGSCERSQIISLSVPVLLDNLVRNSLCLGTGPGYPRNSIDVAIESSIHPSPMSY